MRRFFLEDGLERDAVIRRLEDPARRRGRVIDVGVGLDHGEVDESSAHVCRADVAELEPRQDLGRELLGRG
ncbi:MAG: hypothetical protein E2P02_14180 [Acidobacteria bacterium]|nr:MAG: hypothetical protein E2P02_14180 [Acidobacteriota bacterium]